MSKRQYTSEFKRKVDMMATQGEKSIPEVECGLGINHSRLTDLTITQPHQVWCSNLSHIVYRGTVGYLATIEALLRAKSWPHISANAMTFIWC